MGATVGFVTIGQSPRDDVVPEIARILGVEVEILEKGALDGLSGEEIRNLKPGRGDFRLITRLQDGSTAVVGKRKILPFLEKRIDELAELDVRLIALLCTDEFPSIRQGKGSRRIVLQPSRLLRDEAFERLKQGRLGIFVPLEEQKAAAGRKWKRAGLRVVVEALNPYQETGGDGQAVEAIRANHVDLAVLDCIGYTQKMKEGIQRFLEKPVLLPRAVLAGAIRGLI